MAPKAAPKATAAKAGSAKAKAEKKEKNPEDEIPRVPQPDRAVMDEKLADVQKAIDEFQEQQRQLTNQIGERSGGKDEFNEQRAQLLAERDECSKEMDRLTALKDEVSGSIGQNRQEGIQMRDQLNKMKKQLGYTNESEIDQRIATIEFKMWTDSMTLKEEKAYMQELQTLKRNRPKVSQVNQMEEDINNRDSGLPLKERLASMKAEIAVWRDKKKAVQDKLTALNEQRKEKLGNVPQLIEQRDELGAKIKEKIAERNQIRDEFREEERKYRDYLSEQRRVRAEKAAEERAARQKEFEQRRLIREAEKLDEQPYVAEITLVEQTISFCRSLTQPKVAKKEEATKTSVLDNPEGTELLVTKKDRDEFYLAPTKGGKKAKASKTKAELVGARPIKHNAETFQLFDKLKLDAPITTDDIPALLAQLEEKLTYYNDKVKEWELKRDEMKRIIMEGGTIPGLEEEANATAEDATGAEAEEAEEAKEDTAEEAAEEEEDEENGGEDED